MAWSIFSEGGGDGSAVTWAQDLLSKVGAPESAGNVQMVYDWELAEGGGGEYNPLNVGPDPDDPGLALTGSQYGGGAADYGSWSDGLKATADYLSMQNFSDIQSDLQSNDPVQARNDLFNSPWAASHYGDGADFPDTAVPGKGTALPKDPTGNSPTSSTVLPSWLNSALSFATGVNVNDDASTAKTDLVSYAERGGLIIFGGILIIVGIFVLVRGPARTEGAVAGAATGGAAGAAFGAARKPSGNGSLARAGSRVAKERRTRRDKIARDQVAHERHTESQYKKQRPARERRARDDSLMEPAPF
jgi:hypothetical protein